MAMRCKEISMIGFEKKLCIVWFKWDWGRKDIQYDYICSIIDGTCVGLLAMLSFCTIPCCNKKYLEHIFFRDLNRTHFWYSSEKKVGHILCTKGWFRYIYIYTCLIYAWTTCVILYWFMLYMHESHVAWCISSVHSTQQFFWGGAVPPAARETWWRICYSPALPREKNIVS